MDDISEYMFYSKEGDRLSVRPLLPEDAHFLVDLFEHMGPDSRFLRFNLSLKDPDPEHVRSAAQRMARVDRTRDGAWLAFTDLPDQPNAPVAGARYIRLDPESAEVALAVRDDMQNRGIGTQLLIYLAEQARKSGVHRLVATIQRSNRRLFHILKKAELDLTYESEGSYTTIVVNLVEPDPVL